MNMSLGRALTTLLLLSNLSVSPPMTASEVRQPPTPHADLSTQALFLPFVWAERPFSHAGDQVRRWTQPPLAIYAVVLLALSGLQIRGGDLREGVGSVYGQVVPFQEFHGVAAGSDLQSVLNAVAQYQQHIRDIHDTIAKQKNWTEAQDQAFEAQRKEFADQLLAHASFKTVLLRQLAADGQAYASDDKQRVNQIIYAGLTAYLANNGIANFIFLSFAERENAFMPHLADHHVLENLNLYVIPHIDRRVTRTIWGKTSIADELFISGSLRLGTIDYTTVEDHVAGRTMFGQVFIVNEGIDEDVIKDRATDAHDPRAAALARIEWESVSSQFNPQFLSDPLGFSRTRLIVEGMLNPESDAARRARFLLGLKNHERRHVMDYREGRIRALPDPLTWPAFYNQEMGAVVRRELDGIMTEVRDAFTYQRKKQLRQILSVLGPAGSQLSLSSRLTNFNFVDLMLGELAQDRTHYPELIIKPRTDVTLRGQIAGQLYRLTPESIARALDAMHAARELHPEAVRLDTPDVKKLVQGPLYTGTPAPALRPAPKKAAADGSQKILRASA
jgi:hypothetical protein